MTSPIDDMPMRALELLIEHIEPQEYTREEIFADSVPWVSLANELSNRGLLRVNTNPVAHIIELQTTLDGIEVVRRLSGLYLVEPTLPPSPYGSDVSYGMF